MKIKVNVWFSELEDVFRAFKVKNTVAVQVSENGTINIIPQQIGDNKGRLELSEDVFIDEKFSLAREHNFTKNTDERNDLVGEAAVNTPSIEEFINKILNTGLKISAVKIIIG